MNRVHPETETKPLDIAVICEAHNTLPGWVVRLIGEINSTNGLCLKKIFKIDAERDLKPPSLLFKTMRSLERKFVPLPSQLAGVELTEDLCECPIVAGRADLSKNLEQFDIVLDLTESSLANMVSPEVQNRIWFLDFLKSSPAALALTDIANKVPASRIALCQLDKNGHYGEVASASFNRKMFAIRHHLFLCEKSVSLVVRELKRAARFGTPDPAATQLITRITPSSLDLSKYAAKTSRDLIAKAFEALASRLGFRPGAFHLQTQVSDALGFEPENMSQHHAPANTYYADPFLWEHEGEMFCFFETYDYSSKRGHIDVGRLENGQLTDVRTALKPDYHVSFPFLFEHKGELYMLPVSCEKKRIDLWKCDRFPYEWSKTRTLMTDTIAADSFISEIEGEWWLFTNLSHDPFDELSSELHLFKLSADDLSIAEAHPLNPVILDSRSARNGGRVFRHDGKFFRAAQDNAHGLYGFGIKLMEIQSLTLEDYAETERHAVSGQLSGGPIGYHHFDTRSGMVILDARNRLGRRNRKAKETAH